MTTKAEARRPSRSKLPPERVSHFTTPVDDDTLEFAQAIERFKQEKRRPFPTWGEVLAVLKSLGYHRGA